MSEKEYRVDGEPVTANELIDLAREADQDYDDSLIQTTSSAAMILRGLGAIVETNPKGADQC